MPSPSVSTAVRRPDIAGSFEEFPLDMLGAGFVGLDVFPALDVNVFTGRFGKIPVEELLKNPSTTRRASGTPYARSNIRFEDDSFLCEEHGVEEPVDDREAKIYADYFDAEVVSGMRARAQVMRALEARIVAHVESGSAANAGASWATTGDPVADVNTAANAMWAATGIFPNAMVIERRAYKTLIDNDAILDRLKFSGFDDPKKVTASALAALFDLDKIFVAGGTQNTAKEGQTAAFASLWTYTRANLVRVATSRDIREPCVGRAFHYADDGSQIGGVVETYRDENVRSNIVRVRMDTDEKLLYPALSRGITALYG